MCTAVLIVQLHNVKLQNVHLPNVQLHNVQVTKRPGNQKVHFTKRPDHRTSRSQNVQDTKHPVFENLKTGLKKHFSQNMSEKTYLMRNKR